MEKISIFNYAFNFFVIHSVGPPSTLYWNWKFSTLLNIHKTRANIFHHFFRVKSACGRGMNYNVVNTLLQTKRQLLFSQNTSSISLLLPFLKYFFRSHYHFALFLHFTLQNFFMYFKNILFVHCDKTDSYPGISLQRT